MTIRWGIIGCGDVAERKGGPALYHADGSELYAVMSRNHKKAADFARRHGAARHYSRVDDLLADAEVDAVYVATPPHLHAQLTIQAAEAGKHVLCEKPMALHARPCEEMIEACRQHDVQLAVAYYRRFFPAVQKMKALLDEGQVGQPVMARAQVSDYCRIDPRGPRAWLFDPKMNGGYMTDVGCHRIDLLTHLMGEVAEVSAFADTISFDFPVDDTAALITRHQSGVLAVAAFNWNAGLQVDELEVIGTLGRVRATNLGRGDLEVIVGGKRTVHHLPPPEITHLALVQHFVDCVASGTPNRVPGEEGIKATRVLEAAYRSSREKTTVNFEEAA